MKRKHVHAFWLSETAINLLCEQEEAKRKSSENKEGDEHND